MHAAPPCTGAGWVADRPGAGGQNIRIALTDGAAHAVDSNEMAFKLACMYAFRGAFLQASPTVLEPIMNVEVSRSTTPLSCCACEYVSAMTGLDRPAVCASTAGSCSARSVHGRLGLVPEAGASTGLSWSATEVLPV